METVNLKGFPVPLNGELPNEGVKAQDFYYVKGNLNEESLYDLDVKVKILISVPSLDTNVCQVETSKFNEKLAKMKDVKALIISKDLPFAQKRFCDSAKINNVEAVSDFRYGDFGEDYGVLMTDGALKGLLARAVVVLDKDNKIHYSELVSDILMEPDYDSVIEEVEELLKK
jgi:thiol peroxidase